MLMNDTLATKLQHFFTTSLVGCGERLCESTCSSSVPAVRKDQPTGGCSCPTLGLRKFEVVL